MWSGARNIRCRLLPSRRQWNHFMRFRKSKQNARASYARKSSLCRSNNSHTSYSVFRRSSRSSSKRYASSQSGASSIRSGMNSKSLYRKQQSRWHKCSSGTGNDRTRISIKWSRNRNSQQLRKSVRFGQYGIKRQYIRYNRYAYSWNYNSPTRSNSLSSRSIRSNSTKQHRIHYLSTST